MKELKPDLAGGHTVSTRVLRCVLAMSGILVPCETMPSCLRPVVLVRNTTWLAQSAVGHLHPLPKTGDIRRALPRNAGLLMHYFSKGFMVGSMPLGAVGSRRGRVRSRRREGRGRNEKW